MDNAKLDQRRNAMLHKAFDNFSRGEKTISTTRDAQLFLEAIRAQEFPSACIQAVLATGKSKALLATAIRISSNAEFLCHHLLPSLEYMSDVQVRTLYEGQLLHQILSIITDSLLTWNALTKLYLEGKMLNPAINIKTFAWLCVEVASHPNPDAAALEGLKQVQKSKPFQKSNDMQVREFGYQIDKLLGALSTALLPATSLFATPGGRHDNDHENYRDIAIFPTADEFQSSKLPFLRLARDVAATPQEHKTMVHLDNQFRLLREDMLQELRNDTKTALGQIKSRKAIQRLEYLRFRGIYTGNERRRRQCALEVTFDGPSWLQYEEPKRKAFLKKNPNILKHASFGAICSGNSIICFGSIVRDEDKLAMSPPSLVIEYVAVQDLIRTLEEMQKLANLFFVVVDTPVFAYRPVLERLKDIRVLPLESHLLSIPASETDKIFSPRPAIKLLIEKINEALELEESFGIKIYDKKYPLDVAQARALKTALEETVAIIQGPPGTGKSYIGALAAAHLIRYTNTRILILAYTNHALDQFLEDCMNMGISKSCMTRLGSKCSNKTSELLFETQYREMPSSSKGRYGFARASLAEMKANIQTFSDDLEDLSSAIFSQSRPLEVLEHLEFCDECSDGQRFWDAFQAPDLEDGFAAVDKRGKTLNKSSLLNSWLNGAKKPSNKKNWHREYEDVWAMERESRKQLFHNWSECMRKEVMNTVKVKMHGLNLLQKQIDTRFNEPRCDFMRSKLIVGCTTTAAAMYPALIKAASPECILVEEAGEILEAHILTAMNDATKQLILIGDHKQLRPKYNNYNLSVEKGDGYDFNRSLFERRILEGHQPATLQTQHRMVPEISQFVRNMTYRDLKDGVKTTQRPEMRGVRGRTVFVNHSHPETSAEQLRDRRDEASIGSKENEFEANMVLKIIVYMTRQGYSRDRMVVLTPYLGQLRLLRQKLSEQSETILSGPDHGELVRAGFTDDMFGCNGKPQIRLSTIDNYQGEENDIVIASLTRSNERGEIGFMKAPERLNVLISRARNCLIMIGNMNTFEASAAGKASWSSFSKGLKDAGYLHNGFPVRCEQHKEKEFLLACAEDFDAKCPDGGCFEKCNETMGCGMHTCRQRCHGKNVFSHTRCSELVDRTCDKQHSYRVPCSEQHLDCGVCQEEERVRLRRVQRDLDMERKRREDQAKYKMELEVIQDAIEHQKLRQRYLKEQERECKDLKDQTKELERMKNVTSKMEKSTATPSMRANGQSKTDFIEQQSAIKDPKNYEPGSPEEDWEYQKNIELTKSDAIDAIMDMIGLEEVKRSFLDIKSRVDTALRQGASTQATKFGCSFLGNPGTGKTTVARLYATLVTSMSVVGGTAFEETSGSSLANNGVQSCDAMIESMLDKGGGVIFIDEAYQLSSGNSQGGKAVLDFLLTKIEGLTGKICFILAGYRKEMETFFEHNPGLPSRFPNALRFEDYTDDQLLQILKSKIGKDFGGRMKLEGGENGLYVRIAAHRLGRGRGREGFGNARAVHNLLDIIKKRQASRLRRERRQKQKPDDFLLTKADLIGPEPQDALQKSKAWADLQKLIGLEAVKSEARSLMDSIKTNYNRELEEKNIMQYSLNRVFVGNPGTGKTTVAKLYGKILGDHGLLSNGEVVLKTPADFVGSALGESEERTKSILRSALGKVLGIDEAYSLYGGKGINDPYKTAVVDTIVAEVQSVPGDDRCVLLLGYRDQMEDMLMNVNPGLSRRFPLSTAFDFGDFTREEFATILGLKLSSNGFGATAKAKEVALDRLDRARSRRHFGNAGEIDIILNDAMSRHQKRLSAGETKRVSTLEAMDIDPDFNRLERSATNVAKLFEGETGSDNIVNLLQGYQNIVRNSKSLGTEPKESIPFSFLFRGPPGTGKTSTARKIGKVFYDLGFLDSEDVLECSTSDLVGEYVGQTGPKVRDLLDKALGRVLLVDEAYRLNEGRFAKEALDELVDATTKPKYRKKLIIILAGYQKDIDQLLNSNPGLTSRFPDSINFPGFTSTQCVELLIKKLTEKRDIIAQQGTGSLLVSQLETPRPEFYQLLTSQFSLLSQQSGWANARDIIQLSDNIFQRILQSERPGSALALVVTETAVTDEIQRMTTERGTRAKNISYRNNCPEELDVSLRDTRSQAESNTMATVKAAQEVTPAQVDDGDDGDKMSPPSAPLMTRDAGVSDAVWAQLQIDAQAEAERERQYHSKRRKVDDGCNKSDGDEDELRRQLIEELLEEENRRNREQAIKQKLHDMALCPMGFAWIRQADGWRCTGGSHFVLEEALIEN